MLKGFTAAIACFLTAGPILAQPLRTMPHADPVLSRSRIWVAAPGTEQLTPEPSRVPQGRALRFFEQRPALDEVIALQTPAGSAQVPYGYLSERPSRDALAADRCSFGFAFWMPGARMLIGDTGVMSLLPVKLVSRDPLRREHLTSLEQLIARGVTRPAAMDLGSSINQGLHNTFSIIGRDNFAHETEPRMTRTVPKAGTSAFDLYYSTPDGAGGPMPFDVRCLAQGRTSNRSTCDGRVLFPFLGPCSELRIRRESVHLLPEALDVAARLLASWLGKERSEAAL